MGKEHEIEYKIKNEVTRWHTGVEIITKTHSEWVKEYDHLEWDKGDCNQKIATLECRLLHYSQSNYKLCTPINEREDIMDDLRLLYRWRDDLYCAEEGEYPDEPNGLCL